MECYKCKLVINKDSVICQDCQTAFHFSCVGLVTRNKKWKCEKCSTSASSTSSSKAEDRGASNATILQAINDLRKETNEKWDQNKGMWEQFKSQFTNVEEICDSTSASVDALKVENALLKEELKKYRVEMQDLQQHTRKNNIIITGVPLTRNENILGILEATAQALDKNFYHTDISAAHRLRSRKEDPRPPSIVVNFTSRLVKSHWLEARRRKGTLSAKDLINTFPDSKIYLNEHLTSETRDIFNAAMQLKKEKRLSSVWTSDCKVMAKVSAEQRPFRVRDLAHAEKIRKGERAGDARPRSQRHHGANSAR